MALVDVGRTERLQLNLWCFGLFVHHTRQTLAYFYRSWNDGISNLRMETPPVRFGVWSQKSLGEHDTLGASGSHGSCMVHTSRLDPAL
jgi:hypothetical protein